MFFESLSQKFTQRYAVVLVATALMTSFFIFFSSLHFEGSQPQLSSIKSQRTRHVDDSFDTSLPSSILLQNTKTRGFLQEIDTPDQPIPPPPPAQHHLNKRAKIDATWRQIRKFVEDPNGAGQAYLLQSIAPIFDFVSSLEEIDEQVQHIEQLHGWVIALRDAELLSFYPAAQLFAKVLDDLASAFDDVPPNLLLYTRGLLQTIIGVTEPWDLPTTMVGYLFAIDDVTDHELDDDWIVGLIKIFQELEQDLRDWVETTIKAAIYLETVVAQVNPGGQTAQALPGIRSILTPIAQRWANLADTAEEAEQNLERFRNELVNVYLVNDEPTVPSPPVGDWYPNSGGLMDGGGLFGMIDQSADEHSRSELFGEYSQSVYEPAPNVGSQDVGSVMQDESEFYQGGESPEI
ncbi:hypothetical protein TWF696_005796 [Orbilia brochopaga]|uniref:Uncharacterized protein n=1 Tax=Orbilia brochopaga TaxID=3140254 RepID=A0AAV9UUD9_9PEZI